MRKLFEPEYDVPFVLLMILLVFSTLRPDRLLPGGEVLMYFPTVILAILFVYWLQAPYKVLNNSQTKLFILFVLLMVLHVPFVRNFGTAKEIVKGFLVYAITFYVFKIQFINTPDKVIKYVKVMVILQVFVAVMGILGNGKVALPILQDENDFCLLMNIFLPLAYFLGQQEENKIKKFLYYAIAGIFVLGNIASFSRGGFIGFFAVCLYMFYKSKLRRTVILAALFLGVFFFFAAPQTFFDEMKTIETEGASQGTGRIRILLWKAGCKMFVEHPFFGVGPGNFGPWIADYYVYNPSRMWGKVAHSLYITLISEMGLVGALLFMGILRANYKDQFYISNLENRKVLTSASFNHYDEELGRQAEKTIKTLYFISLGYLGAMIAYLTTGAFISVLYYGYFWEITALLAITANASKSIEKTCLNEIKISRGLPETNSNELTDK